MSLRNILTITKFESKVLWRNWFFRIFAILILFFITMFSIAAFSTAGNSRHFITANSWGVTYAQMILLSIGQAAAIIFLATGIIKKDKKVDTNEVFFARPVSNLDYVLGRAFAIFKLFFWLNVIIVVMGLIFNVTNPAMQFNPMTYVAYPLLSSLPSIVFITGFSFLVVTLIRNQPVSIVLLVGISAVIIIYFFDKHGNIFDYMAFRLRMMASDMTGFSGLREILMQRSYYLVTGITFLFATAFFLDRLPSKKTTKYLVGLVTLLFASGSGYLMMNLWQTRLDSMTLRENLIEVNGKWANTPNADIISNYIKLELREDQIVGISELVMTNSTPDQLDRIYFTLNPSLSVSEVRVNNQAVEFGREQHIVSIPVANIAPNANAEVSISYSGTVNEAVAHLEVDQVRYEETEQDFIYAIAKRYAFLQPDYLLLTKDVMWYPDNQIGYSLVAPIKDRNRFIDFQLEVTTAPGQLAISQGEIETAEGGKFKFTPEYPLPQISLAVGNYVKKEIVVDSIAYQVYHYPKNDYFTQHLDQLQDTLSLLIKDLVTSYEHDQKLKYPFKRLQFVEAPVQFAAFNKIYESNQAFVQPEMVFWPEKGGEIRAFDFKRQKRNMDRQAKEENKVLGEREKQANVFNNLVKRVFTKQIGNSWTFDGRDADEPNYAIFPNLYAFNSGIVSQKWSLLNRSISNYLDNQKVAERDFSRNINGISFAEECNELMRESNIMEILTEEKKFSKIQKSVSLKGDYLFGYLGQIVGEEEFKNFIYDWINTNNHQLTSYDQFKVAVLDKFNLEIDPIIQRVYFDTKQPSFEITNNQEYEILDGDRKRYQVIFDVANTGENDGVIAVNFNSKQTSEFSFFRQRDDDDEAPEEAGYLSTVRVGETKRLGFILDAQPENLSINTFVSRNIPSIITLASGTFDVKENARPFEGEEIIVEASSSPQYEVVVDNEDPGFTTFSPIEPTYLRQMIDKIKPSNKKYYGIWRRSYSKWLATTGSAFYGQSIRSAHFTRSGKGEKITKWTPDLEESGFYDLYVYMMGKNQNQFSRRSQNRNYTYQYLIDHGDGEDEINFNISNAERGWNYLGSYYFDAKEGSVVLTDKCEQRTVYADAIKWVKQ